MKPVVVLYHIVDSAVRSRKPIRIIQMEKAPEGGGGYSDTKVNIVTILEGVKFV